MIPKFRGFNKKTKKMYSVEGFKVVGCKIYRCSLADDEFRSGRLETFLFVEDSLDDYILMQSTGLKDKNGIDIFEGDIVKTERCENREDFFGNTFSTKVEYQGPITYLECAFWIEDEENTTPLWSETEELEIIGNIYELESVEE